MEREDQTDVGKPCGLSAVGGGTCEGGGIKGGEEHYFALNYKMRHMQFPLYKPTPAARSSGEKTPHTLALLRAQVTKLDSKGDSRVLLLKEIRRWAVSTLASPNSLNLFIPGSAQV